MVDGNKIIQDEIAANLARLKELRGDDQIVDYIENKPVTRAQMQAAFDLVVNKEHWKLPIDAQIAASAADVALITAAIIFYTGSVPLLVPVKKAGPVQAGKKNYRVTAAGYYRTIGA